MAITQNTWAKVPLPDPSTYYGGYKEPRLLSAGPFRRGLSDRKGVHESASFNFETSDHDYLMRAKMAAATDAKWLLNQMVIARMISDEGRRALLTPRVVGIGWIRDYEPVAEMRFRFMCEDYLALYTGLGQDDKQIPKRLVTRDTHPNCPTPSLDVPVPIIYGRLSDALSTTAPPVLTGVGSEGAFVDNLNYRPNTPRGLMWSCGYGPTPATTAGLAAPTGVALVDDGPGSGTLPTSIPNATYGVMVTAVDSLQREGDPSPFYVNEPSGGVQLPMPAHVQQVTVPDATRSCTATWNPVVGAIGYRCYFGNYSPNGGWVTQFIETLGTTATFTNGPPSLGGENLNNITPGAKLCPYSALWYYAVAAVMSDGQTALSAECRGIGGPYQARPVRVRWEAVAGAVEYRVFRRSFDGDWDRRWTVPSSQTYFDDDQLDTNATFIQGRVGSVGIVPLIPAGTEQSLTDGSLWLKFIVAGHAVKEIEDLFVDGVKVDATAYGDTCCCPGKSGYSTYFPNTGSPQYRDYNGQRFTMVYARGNVAQEVYDGRKRGTANVKGIESSGNGTGTLITDGFAQYLHAMRNWILGDYQTGAWASSGPTWPGSGTPEIEALDDDTFDAASLVAQNRISGGYTGAFIIGANGERESVKTWVQRFNLSLDCFSGISRRSQFFVRMLDTTVGVIEAANVYTETLDVHANTFKIKPRISDMENVILYAWGRNYAQQTWDQDEQTETDDESVTMTGAEKKSELVEMWMTRDATQAVDVAQRRLMRSKQPPLVGSWEGGLQWLDEELGNIIRFSHREGLGPAGYVNQAMFVTRHDLDADRLVVGIEALDVGRLFEGAAILGDTATMAASWTSADEDERRYLYLCDETTGLFSDGSPGKRLR